MMKCKIIILVTLVSLFSISALSLAQELTGKIVAVNESEETILLKQGQQAQEYKLNFNAQIKLNQKEVTLSALRPIDYKSFCEARLQLNEMNQVTTINAVYKAIEVIVLKVKKDEIVVKKLNTGLTRNFELTDRVKIHRNNLAVSAEGISKGDKGLVVLGLNHQLQKIMVYNYQIYGVLKETNPQTREIVINTGTRLNPQYQTLKLPQQFKIKFNQQEIELEELTANMWVKVEIDNTIQKIVVRKI